MKTKQTHFLCILSKFIWWKTKTSGTRKHILLWLHNSNNFLLLSHSSLFVLVCHVYSLWTNLKKKSSFWYYDLIMPPCFVFNIMGYTFVLYWYGTEPSDLLVITCVIKCFRKRIQKDRIKKSPAGSLSVFIFFIFDSTHYFKRVSLKRHVHKYGVALSLKLDINVLVTFLLVVLSVSNQFLKSKSSKAQNDKIITFFIRNWVN